MACFHTIRISPHHIAYNQSNHSYLTSPSEVISVMSDKIEFSPAMPWPQPPDIQKRIQELRGYLDPNNPSPQPEQQHTNIKAAIKLYEDGKIDGVEQVFIKDGKIVPREEIFRGSPWSWCEGRFYQLAQRHAYGQPYCRSSPPIYSNSGTCKDMPACLRRWMSLMRPVR